MRPTVSVIIPTLNQAAYLEQAVQSILRVKAAVSSEADIEIIVVDDGCTDATPEVMSRYPVVFVRNESKGIPQGRNTGLRTASGEFIAFLDHDDAWLDGHISEHLDALQSHPDAAVAYTQGYLADANLRPVYGPCPSASLPSGDLFIWSLSNTIQLGAMVVRKEAIDAVGGFDESLMTTDDTDLQLKLAARFDFIGINRTTVLWRQYPRNHPRYEYWDQSWRQGEKMLLRDARLAARRRPSTWQVLAARFKRRGWVAANVVTMADQCLVEHRPREASRFLLGALRVSPLHASLRVPGFWVTSFALACQLVEAGVQLV
ncbi:MAG: glycosyltransferase family 2 protein [Chloroflexota bacterium]